MTALALLPHLTFEELEELRLAVRDRLTEMRRISRAYVQRIVSDPAVWELGAEAGEKARVLESLQTAIMEAQIECKRMTGLQADLVRRIAVGLDIDPAVMDLPAYPREGEDLLPPDHPDRPEPPYDPPHGYRPGDRPLPAAERALFGDEG